MKAPSTKQLTQNQATLALVMLAVVVWVVGLIISKAVFDGIVFNNKVIGRKRQAESTLKANLEKTEELQTNYEALQASGFDTNRALRALPTRLDIPGLASKLEALLAHSKVRFESFSLDSGVGADPASASADSGATVAPAVPQEFSFSIKVEGTYAGIIKTLVNFENQLSPMRIVTVKIEGTEQNASADLIIKGYYEDAVRIEFPKETIQ
jgi:Tfp pilus assembly protein PilO